MPRRPISVKAPRDAAPGIDGETWRQFGENLESNLTDLSARLRRGAYRAKPVRRVFITKDDGRQRPLGVTALEDKIAQRATVAVLNGIYETDFLGFSYGYRPGKGQHNALDALYTGLLTRKVDWVLDGDISSFFDGLDHDWLVKFIEHRVADQRVLRLIRKWLNAGVLEEGRWTCTEEGTLLFARNQQINSVAVEEKRLLKRVNIFNNISIDSTAIRSDTQNRTFALQPGDGTF